MSCVFVFKLVQVCRYVVHLPVYVIEPEIMFKNFITNLEWKIKQMFMNMFIAKTCGCKLQYIHLLNPYIICL